VGSIRWITRVGRDYLESLVLQDSFDGGIPARGLWFDDLDLEDDAEGSVSDDLDALVLDLDFLLRLPVKYILFDDPIGIQIGYTSS